MVWTTAVAVEPSMSLELRVAKETVVSSPPANRDAALDKLMVRALDHGSQDEVVNVVVVIRARRDILVNRRRIQLLVRDLSDGPLAWRCLHHEPPAELKGDYVRLHPGETTSVSLQAGLICYRLARGDKFGLVAEFEDFGDPLRAPPPAGVSVAMRRVVSNKLVLTYSGNREGRITRR
jgi:hypothetical protein